MAKTRTVWNLNIEQERVSLPLPIWEGNVLLEKEFEKRLTLLALISKQDGRKYAEYFAYSGGRHYQQVTDAEFSRLCGLAGIC